MFNSRVYYGKEGYILGASHIVVEKGVYCGREWPGGSGRYWERRIVVGREIYSGSVAHNGKRVYIIGRRGIFWGRRI